MLLWDILNEILKAILLYSDVYAYIKIKGSKLSA
jgi:hypothetical protein